jgi:hypothetical protein
MHEEAVLRRVDLNNFNQPPRDLSFWASGPRRQPGSGLPNTLTVWPTFGYPVDFRQSRILDKAGRLKRRRPRQWEFFKAGR